MTILIFMVGTPWLPVWGKTLPANETHIDLEEGLSYETFVGQFNRLEQPCFYGLTVDSIVVDSLEIQAPLCSDSSDGWVGFSIKGGAGPYQTSLMGPVPCDNCEIVQTGSSVRFEGLTKGRYEIRINTQFQDTVCLLDIVGPEPITINQTSLKAISCSDICDGAISVNALGGTGPLAFNWGNGFQKDRFIEELCPGTIPLEIRDSLGCLFSQDFLLDEPNPLEVSISAEKAVSCQGAQDGKLLASANQDNVSWKWNTGQRTPAIEGLGLGTYEVSVTNALGCRGVSQIVLNDYRNPFEVNIKVEKAISCYGAEDGVVWANPSELEYSYTYLWSNGEQDEKIDQLKQGTYSVTVTNELGCRESADFLLSQPNPIKVEFGIKNIDCIGGPTNGRLNVSSVFGGNGDYQYAIDENLFTFDPELNYIPEGFYTLKVQDRLGCQAEFPFELEGPPEIKIELPTTIFMKLGEELDVQPLVNIQGLEYKWFTQNRVVSTSSSLQLRPNLTTSYILEALDLDSGCRAFDTLTVVVDQTRQVFIPNAFSPNGDGYNDHFGIFTDQAIIKINQLAVFDRFGNLVFRRGEHFPATPEEGWDGDFQNGRPAPRGVYVYFTEVVFIDGQVEIFKGDVLLMR